MRWVTETNRALTFGHVADEYDRWRPSYPAAAVDWLAPAAPARVADVGAGTGKLTSLLVARGLVVEAVEPDKRMLAVLARNNPTARRHHSVSTAVPVEDASLDAVLVADAWHWFDDDETIAELRRVLRPGGWLGLVWHVAAEPVEPWELDLMGESGRYDRSTKGSVQGLRNRLGYFRDEELDFAQFPWVCETTPEHLAALMATTSMAIAMDEDERAGYLTEDRSKLQAACDAAGRASMPLRFEASCVRWTPRS
ncbi:class I SAM-dependent methyltransferase [soil metagenome]